MVYSNMGTILILINLLTLFLLLKHYLERIKQVCSSSKGGRKKRMSTWDSSRKPFWCTYRFPWQPNNQCLGTLRLGHIYCWPGDGGVQRSENCWKKRLWFEQTRHWHQWQNIQHFIPEIQGKSRWPPKGCKKRSLYDDDFSLDYLHVDACISEQHSCCRLLQIKTHNCLQMGYI